MGLSIFYLNHLRNTTGYPMLFLGLRYCLQCYPFRAGYNFFLEKSVCLYVLCMVSSQKVGFIIEFFSRKSCGLALGINRGTSSSKGVVASFSVRNSVLVY